jgi:RNA polymerase sigma factor (sigma-70 family)
VDISDGDLVWLARAGEPVAFRLLVERYQPMARARAARLSSDPHEVDDVVQESFLQAFVGLDRLREPDRFAGWLGGIVLNVYRAAHRRAPLILLADWPEQLHPVSADGLPSPDDLDRADALRQAVADLPAGQRRAVEMFYYADLPAAQIADSAGAAKASLHKARRRLREHITSHRPDLIPAPALRILMTTVRIAHAEPLPSSTRTSHVLVVLADDRGGRALPVWLPVRDGRSLWRLLSGPAEDADSIGPRQDHHSPEVTPEQITSLLLSVAGAGVTGVDVDELGPGVTAARIELATASGTRQVTTRLADGLALAATAGAPVRVARAVMDRLAVPVRAGDLLGPFLHRELPAAPAVATPPRRRRRYEPRNLAFTDGLDWWELGGGFRPEASGSAASDYSAAAEDQSAVLYSAVPEPAGLGFLSQQIFAEDYRGRTITFRGELRTADLAGQSGLFLRVVPERQPPPPHVTARGASADPDNHFAAITGSSDWTRHEVTAQMPDDTAIIVFGVFLTGRGRASLRNAELTSGPEPRPGRSRAPRSGE